MRILGIDPGLRNTGWGVIEQNGNSFKHVGCGVIKTDSHAPNSQRLLFINHKVRELINMYSPESVAMEEVFINVNAESSKKLIMARTASFIAIAESGFEIFEYRPNEIKRSITGKGHASKDLVYFFTKKLLNISILIDKKEVTYDSIDALAIALCHSFMSRFNERIRSAL